MDGLDVYTPPRHTALCVCEIVKGCLHMASETQPDKRVTHPCVYMHVHVESDPSVCIACWLTVRPVQ